MKHILEDAAQRAIQYLNGLEKRKVAPSAQSIDALKALDVPLQDETLAAESVLAELDQLVSPATMGMAGRRF